MARWAGFRAHYAPPSRLLLRRFPFRWRRPIKRAQSANTAFAAANADTRIAQSEHTIARSLFLPNVVYHNQFLYTQGTGRPADAPIKFIANNAIHEYVSQGSVTETIGGMGIAQYKLTAAAAAAAHARFEVARRGLVVTVVANYYNVFAADAKLAAAQRALDEASQFSTITAKRESNGEVAHADSVRADLQVQQRQREWNDAKVAADRARLDLGVMLFSDPGTPYTLTTSFDEFPALPSRSEVEAAAMANNPELKAAMESRARGATRSDRGKICLLPRSRPQLQLRHRCAAIRCEGAGRHS